MLKLKIEKGVPIPERRRGGGRGYRMVLESLKPTESVLLPVKAYSNAWTAAASSIGRGKFKIAKDGDGFRVWRTK